MKQTNKETRLTLLGKAAHVRPLNTARDSTAAALGHSGGHGSAVLALVLMTRQHQLAPGHCCVTPQPKEWSG